ncbi:MAG: DUF4390 domain-containing protein [Deltaproteobacteria bacterium]|nr:DUF4390 domain-containing protein [Deltaproteobacteria bacterium]
MAVNGVRRGLIRLTREAALGLLCVLAISLPSLAVPPKYFDITNARVDVASGDIVVGLSIGVDNVTGLYEMLKDGASVELVVNASLERPRTLWTNVSLAEVELFSSLQHNPLTREFSLFMPGETKPMLDKNLDRLLDATWRKFAFTLGSVGILDGDNGTDYRITLTLNLQHAKPPPWLAKDFMFWSKKILDPEKVVLPFTY